MEVIPDWCVPSIYGSACFIGLFDNAPDNRTLPDHEISSQASVKPVMP
nr:MAG TPA: hypothetical protein [Caudoviricetes sp.]